jgi:hypothetical protein
MSYPGPSWMTGKGSFLFAGIFRSAVRPLLFPFIVGLFSVMRACEGRLQ